MDANDFLKRYGSDRAAIVAAEAGTTLAYLKQPHSIQFLLNPVAPRHTDVRTLVEGLGFRA